MNISTAICIYLYVHVYTQIMYWRNGCLNQLEHDTTEEHEYDILIHIYGNHKMSKYKWALTCIS